MYKEYTLKIDIKKAITNEKIIYVAGDIGNVLNVEVYNNDKRIDLTSKIVMINTTINNVAVPYLLNIDVANNRAVWKLDLQSTKQAGNILSEIVINEGVTRITSQKFYYVVAKNLSDFENIVEDEKYPILVQLINSVNNLDVTKLAINEEERVLNENIRKSNEITRIENENVRGANENLRKDNFENFIINNQNTINSTIQNVNNINNSIESSEILRESNFDVLTSEMNIGISTIKNTNESIYNEENIRKSNEVSRIENEGLRTNNESLRKTNETVRLASESLRVTEENTRKSNETTRIENENVRRLQEIGRENRILEVEAQIKSPTYSELLTQNTSMFNVGTGKNSSNASVDVSSSVVVGNLKIDTIYGETQKNEVVNGNFANGATGWVTTGSTLSVLNNTLINTSSGINTFPQSYSNSTMLCQTNKKVYAKAKIRVTNSNCTAINFNFRGDTSTGGFQNFKSIFTPVINTWYDFSGIVTIDATQLGLGRVVCIHNYADTTTANGKTMEVQQVMLIDLTAKYGAGNEPTQAQCDVIYANWFDGIKSVGEDFGGVGVHKIEVLSRGKNLFDKSKITSGYYVNNLDGLLVLGTDREVSDFTKLKSNTSYIRTIGEDANRRIAYYDDKFNFISGITLPITGIFSTPVNCTYIRTSWMSNVLNKNNIQIEEGTTSTTYTPYQEDKINILMQNPLRRISPTVADYISGGVVNRNISNWVTLDVVYSYNAEYIGFKRVSTSAFGALGGDSYLLKYNGIILPKYSTGWNIGDLYNINVNTLNITISNSDTGFVDGVQPTTNEIKAYFYGWKMCMSDGSTWDGVATKYWKKITDGTGITSTLPTASYAGYTPYKMLYQLATPSVEQINVETSKPNEPTGFMPLACYEKGSVVINSGIVPTFKYSVPLNLKGTVMDNNSQLKSIKDYVYKLDSFTTAYLLSLETRVTVLESK